MNDIRQITPQEAKEMLEKGEIESLIDVREQKEYEYSRVEMAEHKPMSSVQQWMSELKEDKTYVFFCHRGMRSYQVAAYLKSQGISNVLNMAGGIDAWSVSVDSEVKRY